MLFVYWNRHEIKFILSYLIFIDKSRLLGRLLVMPEILTEALQTMIFVVGSRRNFLFWLKSRGDSMSQAIQVPASGSNSILSDLCITPHGQIIGHTIGTKDRRP